MKIVLGQQVEIETQPRQAALIDTLTVLRMVWLPQANLVRVFVEELNQPLEVTLVSGDGDNPEVFHLEELVRSVIESAIHP